MGKKIWLSIHPINFSSDRIVHTYVRSSTLHAGEILHFKRARILAVNRMANRIIREKITTTKRSLFYSGGEKMRNSCGHRSESERQ